MSIIYGTNRLHTIVKGHTDGDSSSNTGFNDLARSVSENRFSVYLIVEYALNTLYFLAFYAFSDTLLGETCATILFALIGITLCLFIDSAFAYQPIGEFVPILNHRAAAFAVFAVALWSASTFTGQAETNTQRKIAAGFNFGWVLMVFLLLTAETRDFFQNDIEPILNQTAMASSHEVLIRLVNLQQMSISGIWLLYSAGLMGFGILKNFRDMRLAAIALFGISVLKIFVYDLSFLDTLYRIFSFLAPGSILLCVSYAYQKYKDAIIGKV